MEPDETYRRKRRSSRAVVAGLALMGASLLVSFWQMLPPVASTVSCLAGFALMLWGVHVNWLVFYDREPEGPSS